MAGGVFGDVLAGLADEDGAIGAYVERDAVGVDAETDGKAEGLAEPGRGLWRVWVSEDGDDVGGMERFPSMVDVPM